MTKARKGAETESLLPLLHPDGAAAKVLTIGAAFERGQETAGAADLVIIAPPAERRSRAWLAQAARTAAERLDPQGLVYVMAPLMERRAAIQACARQGLKLELLLCHWPNWGSSRYLIPLDAAPMRFAVRQIAANRQRLRRLASGLLASGGLARPLLAMYPWVGAVLRRPGARPCFEWVDKLLGDRPAAVIVRRAANRTGGASLHCLPANEGGAAVILKISPPAPSRGGAGRESEAMARFGECARAAGARVPVLLGASTEPERQFVIRSVLQGELAASVLHRHPRQFGAILDSITGWLCNWNRATMRTAPLDRARMGAELLEPAAALLPWVESGPAYLRWLERFSARLADKPVPLVAAHHELTMWNIVVDGARGLGVIDWETAADGALPFLDLFLAAWDAAGACLPNADRARAYDACFRPRGAYAAAVRRSVLRLHDALGTDPDIALFSFHACWLRFAAHEIASRGKPGAFIATLNAAAAAPDETSFGPEAAAGAGNARPGPVIVTGEAACADRNTSPVS